MDELQSVIQTARFEENPTKTYKMKSNNSKEKIADCRWENFNSSEKERPKFVNHQSRSVHCSPNNKVPTGTMPKTAN